jgi:hypothetical protein
MVIHVPARVAGQRRAKKTLMPFYHNEGRNICTENCTGGFEKDWIEKPATCGGGVDIGKTRQAFILAGGPGQGLTETTLPAGGALLSQNTGRSAGNRNCIFIVVREEGIIGSSRTGTGQKG